MFDTSGYWPSSSLLKVETSGGVISILSGSAGRPVHQGKQLSDVAIEGVGGERHPEGFPKFSIIRQKPLSARLVNPILPISMPKMR